MKVVFEGVPQKYEVILLSLQPTTVFGENKSRAGWLLSVA